MIGGYHEQIARKLSDLIEVAVNDVKVVARRKNYEFNLGVWHAPRENGAVCAVCFAGAVMASSLETPFTKSTYPLDFDSYTQKRLAALNEVRCGDLVYALSLLDTPHEKRMLYMEHFYAKPSFFFSDGDLTTGNGRKKFYQKMREVVEDLRKFDL